MDVIAFVKVLTELEKLKSVERCTYTDSGRRLENSAEHSWHLAMAVWLLAEHLALPVDKEKLLKLALVHDLGEIDGGDTLLYSPERDQASARERQCMTRLAREHSPWFDEVAALWEQQETGECLETRLLRVADRLLPFMLNLATEGRAWRDHGIRRHQVAAKHAFIADEIPAVHHWISQQIDIAVSKGWLAE